MPEINRISKDDALALCTRPEGDLYDKKAAAIDGKKVEKIAVAFANADGGEFIIGIADDKFLPSIDGTAKTHRKNIIQFYNVFSI
ncbi:MULTISPECIES: AlbA family DNA-binding domain-containing protein [Rhizobium]|uniref:AlbA family DNA-binding domain-containing protein n=1 Tax=Rhizobium TaxID=379 RepID=UPI0007F0BF00|nr:MULTISPECIES: RNA-binding domain-containing protein [Rhizobium]ANK98167.1 HTH domain-containing protein [Rhizobium sp. N621]ANL04247.1 HTH domain-containing protein [Rhizobium esperanzae]